MEAAATEAAKARAAATDAATADAAAAAATDATAATDAAEAIAVATDGRVWLSGPCVTDMDVIKRLQQLWQQDRRRTVIDSILL